MDGKSLAEKGFATIDFAVRPKTSSTFRYESAAERGH